MNLWKKFCIFERLLVILFWISLVSVVVNFFLPSIILISYYFLSINLIVNIVTSCSAGSE